MRATELIKQLQDIVAEHGDKPVVNTNDEPVSVEFQDDDGGMDAAIVVE